MMFLVAIVYTIITIVFYKIFMNSVLVIKESKIKKAFSIEEIIGTSLLVAIAVSAFKDLTIFNYSIRNILSVFIVLFLGWAKWNFSWCNIWSNNRFCFISNTER